MLGLLAACATATPRPKLCEEVKGNCLELSFDGESCTYEGPAEIKAGPIVLVFYNESDVDAAVNLVRHTGDETIQDMIEFIGEEPAEKYQPLWVKDLDTWKQVRPGESRTLERVLEPGIHTMVCAQLWPGRGWFGAGLTVKD